MLWFFIAIFGGIFGFSTCIEFFGQFWGIVGGIAGLLIGFFIGYKIYAIIDRRGTRSLFREIKESSNDQLWNIVNMGFWNFYQTLALLNLAAREQDVTGQLPRIFDMLESENKLTRIYGWDALRLVFNKETELIGSYDPRASTKNCRDKVAKLRMLMEQAQKKSNDGNPVS